MGALPKTLSNALVYIEGVLEAVVAKEITLPSVEYEFTEYEAVGLPGTPEFPTKLNPLEMEIVFTSFYRETGELLFNPKRKTALQIVSQLDVQQPSGLPTTEKFVAYTTVSPKEGEDGTFEQGEYVQPERTFAVYRYVVEIAGQKLIEIDTLNPFGIKINGSPMSFAGGRT